MTGSATASANFTHRHVDRRCGSQLERVCRPKKFLWFKIGESCTERYIEVNCVAAHTVTTLQSMLTEIDQSMHLQIEFPQLFDAEAAKRKLLFDFVALSLETRVEQLQGNVSRVVTGQSRSSGQTSATVSAREFGLLRYDLLESVEIDYRLPEPAIYPLRHFLESDFYECWQNLPGNHASANKNQGIFRKDIPCPVYEGFRDRMGL
jgi:hypothetical protein